MEIWRLRCGPGRGAARERNRPDGISEGAEIFGVNLLVELHAEDGVDEEDQADDEQRVEDGVHRDGERVHDNAQRPQLAEEPQHTERPHQPQDGYPRQVREGQARDGHCPHGQTPQNGPSNPALSNRFPIFECDQVDLHKREFSPVTTDAAVAHAHNQNVDTNTSTQRPACQQWLQQGGMGDGKPTDEVEDGPASRDRNHRV